MNELSSRGCGPEETPPRCTLIVNVEPGRKSALHFPENRSASSMKDTADVHIVVCIIQMTLHASDMSIACNAPVILLYTFTCCSALL